MSTRSSTYLHEAGTFLRFAIYLVFQHFFKFLPVAGQECLIESGKQLWGSRQELAGTIIFPNCTSFSETGFCIAAQEMPKQKWIESMISRNFKQKFEADCRKLWPYMCEDRAVVWTIECNTQWTRQRVIS